MKTSKEIEDGDFYAPTGRPIVGTSDTIPGCALIVGFRRKSTGEIEYDYEGQTEVDWDGQTTNKKFGEIIFQDDLGNTWRQSTCLFVPTGAPLPVFKKQKP